ncbi:hypothetical protein D3870_05730 [Noviherbaspirillum cavernae]|uniref:Uncharacterized protein n=1 Tax=Noviherbaspirillum cavernae TaxID=2320862 RepID=A0A418WZB6_9BURK|nr:hypothetical protein D3870_05730 [Noviherbaspirillum cavernae]
MKRGPPIVRPFSFSYLKSVDKKYYIFDEEPCRCMCDQIANCHQSLKY